MRTRFWIGLALLATLAMVSATSAARANGVPMTLCNKTSIKIGVAVGYFTSGVNDAASDEVLTGPFVSHGYSYLEPGECGTFDNPSSARYMFWFAFGQTLNTNDVAVSFMRNPAYKYHFCVRTYFVAHEGDQVPPFTYEDENESVQACDSAGGRSLAPPYADGHTLWITPVKVDLLVDPHVDFTGCKSYQCAEMWEGP